ncbi:NADPH-dependent FMN reductase [Roseomonas marmotae]|uniref:NAD(P)H-dependent oxidoreductase n=1 Tax=Roseomonas marmotae TaxID=2768161 RepID=A0ABS3K7M2_9PROT|nr:NAD(P)H-dependent oxidoreductase [Roseomonas marmotae]MBO1072992.1 NAD(P)H-dependent oxidoreductase [Roseomonas marmotae]QTI79359.1 NAD(P)H-dependent oxidoreductase [Roseomonas marmotae]
MTVRTVAVLVGSLHADSINRKLAQALAKLAAPEMEFRFVDYGDLPLYRQDIETSSPEADRMRAQVKAADAVLFISPEYNRSIPGALKNAIDWGSRPYGRSVWAGKPVAIGGTSPSAVGTAAMQQHLRAVLTHMDMALMSQPELFLQFKEGLIDAEGNVTNEGTRAFLASYLKAFATWIDRLAPRA